ncbi:U4/U5/U6 small nuclear ribonucleoprotein prp3 [Neophaeococcomyces mojaviensis]|uniref:U4/U5/U6 small nuclear ribonucleoprotein prp3 n=1 Tax=Neophaeococcomyces mojaviensis TaxID=3383035 RepID=A0ACC3AC09_9EURO|nr:U4/U5/U6 small nuclear ribonucleoprotein prp3 [Knufia sp. JES_112]
MAENLLKRPHPEDEEAANKRSRSNNGSPVPTVPGAKPDISAAVAAARAKAEEIKKRLAKSTPAAVPSAPAGSSASSAVSDRIAQLKARVAAATSRSKELAQSKPSIPSPPVYNDDLPRGRGGLDIGLHPALQENSQQDRLAKGKTPAGKNKQKEQKKAQLDLSGPSLEELKANPYFDSSISVKNASAKGRLSRQLVFNQQGKYIQQAAALRRQAHLEEMKRKIAERTRQIGMEEDIEAEKAFEVEPPPEIEWWDEGLVNGKSYDAIDDPKNMLIDTDNSIITIYIQHPVLIEPPQEKIVPPAKPMFLTTKEQAKLRRQRRMADLKEKQAKIRLGLEPPPPPKVKKSNLMRVLGEQAIQDPTAVEARVNREIADRKAGHEQMNEERKLSKEERHEKLEKKQAEDAAKGIHVRVYKIDSLANGKHRYQVSINADQNKLTGVCIMHPKFNLVIVEGGEHSVRAYDKLMQNRIKWQEMEAPTRAVAEGNRELQAKWLEAEDENGELKDLSRNRCDLIFSGEEKRRAFRKWLGARVCESDSQARDVLSRAKMDSFWSIAKNWKKDEY